MDQIQLTGLRAYGYTGALPEETVLGQWFEVDLILYLDLSKATRSDDLADTYDYRQISQQVLSLVREQKFQLIERLAGAIATAALDSDPRLHQVKVRLTKLAPPIPDFSGQITVEILHQR